MGKRSTKFAQNLEETQVVLIYTVADGTLRVSDYDFQSVFSSNTRSGQWKIRGTCREDGQRWQVEACGLDYIFTYLFIYFMLTVWRVFNHCSASIWLAGTPHTSNATHLRDMNQIRMPNAKSNIKGLGASLLTELTFDAFFSFFFWRKPFYTAHRAI